MKRYLAALILPIMLAACAGGSSNEGATTLPAMTDNATLNSYNWQLADARNAQGMLITPLFVQSNRPVQLNFSNGRVQVSNTCNSLSGNYTLSGNNIQFSSMVSTRMACMDARIAALDTEVSNRLRAVNVYRIVHSAQPALMLTTGDGDVLTFKGYPTPELQYGGPGETIFLEVAPQMVSCSHPLMANAQCLRVRQINYDSNGIQIGNPGEWQPLYQNIQGYTFQPGTSNVLRVKRYKIVNPPADASDTAYVLDMVVQSQLVPVQR